MTDIILICTVGGSYQPICRAIREVAPTFVSFICSGKDPATGQPGSDIQIKGKGSVIKKHPKDDKPSLPNIPTQTGLTEGRYEIVEVPADDLDEAFVRIRDALKVLTARFPEGRFLADYTGGTKTMTAALVTAALESERVHLQLVTGSRTDLIAVRDGMETVTSAGVERIRLERAMAPYLAAWRRYAYGEAARGLAGLSSPLDGRLRAELTVLRDLSRAFDAWDRFEHTAAAEYLESYRPRLGPSLPKLLTAINHLAENSPRQEPSRLFDLWRNAQRRAAQGRYDDAVARLYRLLEWSAQWVLRSRCDINTSDVPAERVPDGMELSRNRKGKLQAPLFAAWDLIGRLTDGAAAAFIKADRERLQDLIEMRNHSILAHGFEPIDQQGWERFSAWVDARLIPVLQEEAVTVRVRALPPQLPTEPPSF